MQETIPLRHFKMEGIANFRDLGGLPCDAGYTKYGVFFRSSNLHNATSSDIKTLESLAIREIIDLRYPNEAKREPDKHVPGARNENISLMGSIELSEINVKTWVPGTRTLYRGFYRKILDKSQSEISAVLKKLIWGEGVSLFHCASGKDRTGLIAALLSSMIGVSDEDIIADYMISQVLVMNFTDDISGTDYHNMLNVLLYLRKEYGGVCQYLKSIGMTRDDFVHLREKFTVSI